jgi:hypothetical protein
VRLVVKASCILCVENLHIQVQVIVRRLYAVSNAGKEDLAKCAQIFCPMRSWFCGILHVRRLKEDNKEDEELVDVSPHWG